MTVSDDIAMRLNLDLLLQRIAQVAEERGQIAVEANGLAHGTHRIQRFEEPRDRTDDEQSRLRELAAQLDSKQDEIGRLIESVQQCVFEKAAADRNP